MLCNSLGLIPLVDNTNGIIQAIFSCHILISSCLKSVLLEPLGDGAVKSVTVRNSYIYGACFFDGFFSITISGLLLWTRLIVFYNWSYLLLLLLLCCIYCELSSRRNFWSASIKDPVICLVTNLSSQYTVIAVFMVDRVALTYLLHGAESFWRS